MRPVFVTTKWTAPAGTVVWLRSSPHSRSVALTVAAFVAPGPLAGAAAVAAGPAAVVLSGAVVPISMAGAAVAVTLLAAGAALLPATELAPHAARLNSRPSATSPSPAGRHSVEI